MRNYPATRHLKRPAARWKVGARRAATFVGHFSLASCLGAACSDPLDVRCLRASAWGSSPPAAPCEKGRWLAAAAAAAASGGGSSRGGWQAQGTNRCISQRASLNQRSRPAQCCIAAPRPSGAARPTKAAGAAAAAAGATNGHKLLVAGSVAMQCKGLSKSMLWSYADVMLNVCRTHGRPHPPCCGALVPPRPLGRPPAHPPDRIKMARKFFVGEWAARSAGRQLLPHARPLTLTLPFPGCPLQVATGSV